MVTLLISHRFADYDNIPGTRKVTNRVTSIDGFSVVKIDKADALRINPGDSAKVRYDELAGDGIKPPNFDAVHVHEVKK